MSCVAIYAHVKQKAKVDSKHVFDTMLKKTPTIMSAVTQLAVSDEYCINILLSFPQKSPYITFPVLKQSLFTQT